MPRLLPTQLLRFVVSYAQPDLEKRLGCGARGAQDIKDHPYFEDFDWAALEAGTLRPPFACPAPADPLSAAAVAAAPASEFDDGPSER